MRISDWSSDVCSSDLGQREAHAGINDPRILAEGRDETLFLGSDGVDHRQPEKHGDGQADTQRQPRLAVGPARKLREAGAARPAARLARIAAAENVLDAGGERKSVV